jgi:hypothetical protein
MVALLTAGLETPTNGSAARIDLAAVALDAEWRQTDRYNLSLQTPEGARATRGAPYDVHSILRLRPGRYEIRFAVETGGRTGSVLQSIDVPDISKEVLWLSGILFERQPAVHVKNGALVGLLPVVPTSVRDFGSDSHVSTFIRVYQGGRKPGVMTSLTTRITDERDQTVFESTSRLEPELFGPDRAADHVIQLPVSRLRPGVYVLRVEAAAGPNRATRSGGFTIH